MKTVCIDIHLNMPSPIPKTKVDEIRDTISNAKLGETFSEFKYARCLRLLSDIQSFTAQDQLNMYKSIVELYMGNCRDAKSLALANLKESENFQVLRNCAFIFQQVLALDLVVDTMEKIIEVSTRLNINPKETLTPGYQLNYFLSGNLKKGEAYFTSNDLEKVFESFFGIRQTIGISDKALDEVLQIVHGVTIENNIQSIYVEYSYVEEELLITIHVNKSIEEISNLNTMVAKRCYQAGLLDDLNKVSYMILPARDAAI